MKFSIEFVPSANEDLSWYKAYEQRIIVKAILRHLQLDANVSTTKRKKLRPNPLAPWELRVGTFRVFYDVEVDGQTVKVTAVGHKEHNALFIRGRKVEL